ncbi:HpcH/HpaI aldolase/citrate lyase family protein [Martelella radicis]|uniref:Citrate lyase subunit beta/citryl-CoA lyase n=1 Tax=Martelella radicis TaxID=1397476 RepID=A0A7W6PBQ7_9HYPH|nr:CoA ester lyase [Martelella radicis]MBB4122667.1 citrate lyase subunit beta/citryl-CoA lyase [Martelella radicis]
MTIPRSYLFVPGSRPDRFAKAAAAGAGAVIFDLEDAVGHEDKDAARAHVAQWFAEGGDGLVRINGIDTPWHDDDIAALRDIAAEIMVPKAAPAAMADVAARLPGRQLLALVETVAGFAALRDTVNTPGLMRLAFGNLDFSADARIPEGGHGLDHARFELVLASRLGGLLPPIDGVTTALADPEAIARDVRHARSMGFGAKLCIHPAQVAPVNEGFAPSNEEVVWARRVIAALEGAKGAAVQLDGKMIDRPLIDHARHILQGIDPA